MDTGKKKKRKSPPPASEETKRKRMRNLVQNQKGYVEKSVKLVNDSPMDLDEALMEAESKADVVPIDRREVTIEVPIARDDESEGDGGPVKKRTIPITTKAVLDKNEYAVYTREVKEWFESHPDWNMKEDVDDINLIAMEKVIQYRLLLKKKRSTRSNIDCEYSESVKRMQGFRQNLAARRADRQKAKKPTGKGLGGIGTLNIAVLAGKVDESIKEVYGKKSQALEMEELEMFPSKTI